MFNATHLAYLSMAIIGLPSQDGGRNATQEARLNDVLWRVLEGRHIQALRGDDAEPLLATSSVLVNRESGERTASEIRLYRQADMALFGSIRMPLDLHSGGNTWSCDLPWRVIPLSGDFVAVAVDNRTSELVTARLGDGSVARPVHGARAVLDQYLDAELPLVLLSTASGVGVWNLVSGKLLEVMPHTGTGEKGGFVAARFVARGKDAPPDVWACWGGALGATLQHWREGDPLRTFLLPCLSGSAEARLTMAVHDADGGVRVAIGQPNYDRGSGRVALIGIPSDQAEGRIEALYCGRPDPRNTHDEPDQRNFGQSPMFLPDGRLAVGSPWAFVPSIDLLNGESGERVSQYLVGFQYSIGHSLALSASGEILTGGSCGRGFPESPWERGAVFSIKVADDGSLELAWRHEFGPEQLLPK